MLISFYRNLVKDFEKYDIEEKDLVEIILEIVNVLKNESVIDWQINSEKKRIMKSKLDDYLFDTVKMEKGVNLSNSDIKTLIEKTMTLAQNNYDLL